MSAAKGRRTPDHDADNVARALSFDEDEQRGDVTSSEEATQGNPGKPQHVYEVDDRDRSAEDPIDGAAPL